MSELSCASDDNESCKIRHERHGFLALTVSDMQIGAEGTTRTSEAHLGHRQRQRLMHRHVLLCKGMEDPFSQSDRLPRFRLQLWQGVGGGLGYCLEGSVFKLGQVLEEAEARQDNIFVVFHLEEGVFCVRQQNQVPLHPRN